MIVVCKNCILKIALYIIFSAKYSLIFANDSQMDGVLLHLELLVFIVA